VDTIGKVSIGNLAIHCIVYSLQPHCSYVNRANFSQASRGFVSDSWAFLLVPHLRGEYSSVYKINIILVGGESGI